MASSKCDVWMEFGMDSDTWQMKFRNLSAKHFVDMVRRGEMDNRYGYFLFWGERNICQSIKGK